MSTKKGKKAQSKETVEAAKVQVLEVAPQETDVTTEAAPVKKPRVNKRPYIPFLGVLLEEGQYTKAELLKAIMDAHPEVNKNGVSTVLTDLKNPKYNIFKERAVVVVEGKYIFQDCIKAEPVETEQPPENHSYTVDSEAETSNVQG